MKQLTLMIFCGLLAATCALAQENTDPPAAPAAADEASAANDATEAAAAEAGDAETDDVDDADLDLQTYEEDDDDFVPTEEIPADEPIPFPTNI